MERSACTCRRAGQDRAGGQSVELAGKEAMPGRGPGTAIDRSPVAANTQPIWPSQLHTAHLLLPAAHLAAHANEQQALDIGHECLHCGQHVEVGGQGGLDPAGSHDVGPAAGYHLHGMGEDAEDDMWAGVCVGGRVGGWAGQSHGGRGSAETGKNAGWAGDRSHQQLPQREQAPHPHTQLPPSPTGFGVNRSFSSLCTHTTASTLPDSSISIAICRAGGAVGQVGQAV